MYIFVSTVVAVVDCFAKSLTICKILLLTRLQAWVCKNPQTLTPLRRTATKKHG